MLVIKGDSRAIFSTCKNVKPSCPSIADIRNYIDSLVKDKFLGKDWGYVKGISKTDELVFARLSDE